MHSNARDTAWARLILRSFVSITGSPVRDAVIVHKTNDGWFTDVDAADVEHIREVVSLVCFSALSKREYFELSTWNSDCFRLDGIRFPSAPDTVGFMTRRRDGSTSHYWELADISFTQPLHTWTSAIELDEPVLTALTQYRGSSTSDNWARMKNAIELFNLANSDNDLMPHHVEWVLLCSAFQQLLDTKSNCRDLADEFARLMAPMTELTIAKSKRNHGSVKDNSISLRHVWMYQFCSMRGHYAHGNLDTHQPSVWNWLEHVMLATGAFPMCVKLLLSSRSLYELSYQDRVFIEAFERLMDENWTRAGGNDQQPGSAWHTVMDVAANEVRKQILQEKMDELIQGA